MNKFLPEDEWRRIQASIPISCVDVLPLLLDSKGDITAIGLILRETPREGRKLCIPGGRLLLDESFADAIKRQLCSTLGNKVNFNINDFIQPLYAMQYFREFRNHVGFDPRQHAIGLTFAVPCSGVISPQGEALDFKWFNLDGLPQADCFGFSQNVLIEECLGRLLHNQNYARENNMARVFA